MLKPQCWKFQLSISLHRLHPPRSHSLHLHHGLGAIWFPFPFPFSHSLPFVFPISFPFLFLFFFLFSFSFHFPFSFSFSIDLNSSTSEDLPFIASLKGLHPFVAAVEDHLPRPCPHFSFPFSFSVRFPFPFSFLPQKIHPMRFLFLFSPCLPFHFPFSLPFPFSFPFSVHFSFPFLLNFAFRSYIRYKFSSSFMFAPILNCSVSFPFHFSFSFPFPSVLAAFPLQFVFRVSFLFSSPPFFVLPISRSLPGICGCTRGPSPIQIGLPLPLMLWVLWVGWWEGQRHRPISMYTTSHTLVHPGCHKTDPLMCFFLPSLLHPIQ